jgi:ArsR family transcriptional regulator
MKNAFIDSKTLFRAVKTLRILAHPVRLQIIEHLKSGKRSVGELGAALQLPQAVVSKHLALLKKGGVLASQTDCNFRHYSLTNTMVLEVLNCIKKSCPKED